MERMWIVSGAVRLGSGGWARWDSLPRGALEELRSDGVTQSDAVVAGRVSEYRAGFRVSIL